MLLSTPTCHEHQASRMSDNINSAMSCPLCHVTLTNLGAGCIAASCLQQALHDTNNIAARWPSISLSWALADNVSEGGLRRGLQQKVVWHVLCTVGIMAGVLPQVSMAQQYNLTLTGHPDLRHWMRQHVLNQHRPPSQHDTYVSSGTNHALEVPPRLVSRRLPCAAGFCK